MALHGIVSKEFVLIKLMKKTGKIIAFLLFCNSLSAQVAIGKTPNNPGAILDFPQSTTNGIILPAVSELPATLPDGSLLLDKSDLKIKMKQNAAWSEMSSAGDVSKIAQNTSSEVGNGVIIGSNTSAASGVLVLEATDKALALPQVASPQLNVKSPYPGMICYDTTTKTVAVFDGKVWTFLK